MKLSEMLLSEFDHEMSNTHKTLERVPEEKLDFRPHPKSWDMAHLAMHIANLPVWAVSTIEQESLDLAPADPAQAPPRLPAPQSRQEILDHFARTRAAARAAIASASNEVLLTPWTLLHAEKEVFTLPRIAVLRGFVMNHLIHHRAQLTVYLRLCDIPVPALYGPSADEEGL